MNSRRSFLQQILKAGAAAMVLPAATTYARRWVKSKEIWVADWSTIPLPPSDPRTQVLIAEINKVLDAAERALALPPHYLKDFRFDYTREFVKQCALSPEEFVKEVEGRWDKAINFIEGIEQA